MPRFSWENILKVNNNVNAINITIFKQPIHYFISFWTVLDPFHDVDGNSELCI